MKISPYLKTGVFGILLHFCLAACNVIIPQPTITPSPTTTNTLTPPPTITFTPTPSPIPALTSTQTFTPTPELWVSAETPLPVDLLSIRTDNAHLVSALTEWKEPLVNDLEWLPQNHGVLTVVTGERIKFYDIFSQRFLRELFPQGQPVVDVAFNPRGSWLVSASRRGSETEGFQSSLELWLGPDWKPMGLLYDAPRAISHLEFSPNGLNMAATFTSYVKDQNSLEIWSTTGWQITSTVSTGVALQVAYAPAVDLLAITPDRYAIRLWNLKEEVWQFNLYTSFTGAVTQIAFSPDSGVLASGHYDGFIRIWDLRTGSEILTIPTGAVVESLAFSRDGRILASGGSYEDSIIRLWDSGNGELLRELHGHQVGVVELTFSPDSQFLVSASYDGLVRVWGIRQ